MLTPQDRIKEHLEAELERLTLEREDVKEELQVIKKMLEDATVELKKN